MAYSTNNSLSAISITNFGAKGDGITNDTNAIQSAINSLYPRGGGVVFIPKGNYLTNGYINITGHNIKLFGEGEISRITTARSGDFKKINISGASGFSMTALSIDAGRVTSGRAEQYIGTINIFNAPYFKIENCSIGHSEGLLVDIRGNTYCGTISNNIFEDFHIALHGHSNDLAGGAYNRITVRNNTIKDSWGDPWQQNYFGAIKFQNIGGEYDGVVPFQSYGHEIIGNKILNSSQMGIEFFGYMSDSIISNNHIKGAQFGVSIAASSFGITVANNVIKESLSYGIEFADSQRVTAIGNIIEGASGNNYIYGAELNSYTTTTGICNTQVGIIANGAGRRPNFYNIIGNSISDCSVANVQIYACDTVNVIGNTMLNRARFPGQSFNDIASHNVKLSENKLIQISTGSYFAFIDASSLPCSGITISNNQFMGNISQWGIFYYNNGSPTSFVKDALIENNDTTNVKYCQYGMVNYTSAVQRALVRNNFGPTGGLGYSIADGQIPAGSAAYTTSDIKNGYQYYGGYNFTIPTGGCTGNGIWVCVWSGGAGSQNNVRISIENDYLVSDIRDSLEIEANMFPYGGFYRYDTLNVTPGATINTASIFKQVKTWGNSTLGNNSIWVRIGSVGSGAVGAIIPIKYSTQNAISSPVSTYAPITNTSNNANIYLDTLTSDVNVTPKFSNGVSVGSAPVRILSAVSGALNLAAQNGVAINYNGTPQGKLSFGQTIQNTTIALYDDPVGPTIYGIGIAPFNFRFHVDAATSRFSFHDAPAGNELFTINGNGRVGVNVNTPGSALHVNGSVCLSGIATSITATSGAAILPTNPIGFVTINITGGNFKIPYYGV